LEELIPTCPVQKSYASSGSFPWSSIKRFYGVERACLSQGVDLGDGVIGLARVRGFSDTVVDKAAFAEELAASKDFLDVL